MIIMLINSMTIFSGFLAIHWELIHLICTHEFINKEKGKLIVIQMTNLSQL